MITLTKHHGLGNDFLVTSDVVVDGPATARRLCDRRRGIGADGLLLLGRPAADAGVGVGVGVGVGAGAGVGVGVGVGLGAEATGTNTAALTMVLFNADGSRAEMSGNGIRCLAQAAYRRDGHVDRAAYLVATDGGVRHVIVTPTDDPETVWVDVEMGSVTQLDEPLGWADLGVDSMRPVMHLSLGNPHTVVAVDDVAAVGLLELGERLPHVNLEIVEPGPERNEVTMRVHERGAGITEACGTGACATGWAARQWGLVDPKLEEIVVRMPGGDAKVRFDAPRIGEVTLIGPATYVGTVTM